MICDTGIGLTGIDLATPMGKGGELHKRINQLTNGSEPLFNQFTQLMGLKEIVGKVFIGQKDNKEIRKNATSESALRKRADKKGRSMCFQAVSRDHTMVKIMENYKHQVDCKYNPNFNQLEKRPEDSQRTLETSPTLRQSKPLKAISQNASRNLAQIKPNMKIENSVSSIFNDIAFMTEIPQVQKNRVVMIDKQLSRETISFLNSSAVPNENRFININKSPEILSSVRRVGNVSISKYSTRKEMPIDQNKPQHFYDYDEDCIKSKLSKVVPNFNKFSSRKDQVIKSEHSGFVDNTQILKGLEQTSSYKRLYESTVFEKQLERDYGYLNSGFAADYSLETFEKLPVLEKVDHSTYLPNSLTKKQNRLNQSVISNGSLTDSKTVTNRRALNYSMELRNQKRGLLSISKPNRLENTEVNYQEIFKPYQM
ncbi:UNKNOWN [Stylonychia lemnae]|uniref:Uncharacterized protein n=1 Tax=Stylonychia lemnae TaxID=5949 RepID=A0A078BDS2_STYLE|nr:UNKNOWN [Stylonychia lemnae]|eukprot:CDW91728.1 UNKNOWN [Stylonychia lemnae]